MVMTARLEVVVFLFIFLLTLGAGVTSARPTIQSEQSPFLDLSASSVIDREAFLRSVPARMTVGQTYRVVVIVTNTGTEPSSFFVDLVYPYRYSRMYFYCPQVFNLKVRWITLDPYDSQKVEFTFTPLVEHVGAMEIEARVYLTPESELVDSVCATVYEVRTALPIELLWWAIGLVILAIFVLLVIIFLKRPASRLDLLLSFVLLAMALPLRILSAVGSSLHLDESIFWVGSFDFLNNDWVWTKEYMLIGYPPLFYYLLAGITFLSGRSLMATRTISIISGSLAVVVLYFLAKSLFNTKVGLASALLLCFANYFILYNGFAMTDSLVILLMLLFAYFFWVGWQKSILKYFVLSGFFLGLAFDVKYVVLVLIPAVILFIVWVEKGFRPLLKRGNLVLAASFLVTVSPVQLTLLVNGADPLGIYLNLAFGPTITPGQTSFSVLEYIPRGFRMLIYSMARAASPWLPWLPIFEIAICISFFLAATYHTYGTISKRKPNESFILIFMVATLSLLIDPIKHNKWLLYSFPFFFTMLSNMTDQYVHDIIARTSRPSSTNIVNLFKIFVILFAFIFAFSNTFVGLAAPFIDRGEFAGLSSSMLFLRNRAQPDDIIAAYEVRPIYYYTEVYDIEAACVSLRLLEAPRFQEGEDILKRMKLNEQLLTTLKPRFIIENRLYFNYYYSVTTKQWIFENYHLVFFSHSSLGYHWAGTGTDVYEYLVFERKD